MKVPRLVKMNANQMEDVKEAKSGDICAMFGMQKAVLFVHLVFFKLVHPLVLGVECHSGHTFTDSPTHPYAMTSMHIPEPVMSLAVAPKNKTSSNSHFFVVFFFFFLIFYSFRKNTGVGFSKALGRFQKEDPTFRVHFYLFQLILF
jgi:elongation factor G